MTGLPAARQTDMTFKGGPITQGSLTVHIGSSGGVACSTCPGGVSVGNPVNPMLGAKVQSGEVDLALPGPMPFVLSRDYSSYQTDTPAPVGLLGPGWWLPTEVTLRQTADTLTLNDSKGRSIRFDPLAPGQAAYSRSENLWIVRGGLDRLDLNKGLPVSRLNLAWMGLHEGDRRNPSLFFVTNNLLGPWWVLGTTAPADQVTGKRLHLFGINDRFGRSLRLKRSAEGHVVAVQDGVGRQYRLELKTLAGLATEASGGWGDDCGVRLMAVYLTHDPHEPDLPHHPLVRYEYSPRGELIAVYGRDGSRNRAFQYHPQLPGRMTAHAYEGRPPVLYVYNEAGKVVEQQRQGALSYRLDYAEDSTTVTDSLGRKTIYHFKGEAGLRRVVKLERPDGSTTQSRFDGSGRLLASVNALGEETRYELDVATGSILSITQPDGLQSRFSYNSQGQLEQVIRANGASDRYDYDAQGRIAIVIDALGHKTKYEYKNVSTEHPTDIEDARGGKKHLNWDAKGQLGYYTDCSGSTTHFHYDRWGHLVEVNGEEGFRIISKYDLRGRLTARTNGLNQTISYTYNEASDLTQITGLNGNFVTLERDPQGRLRLYGYGGYYLQFDYDEAGRPVRLINENGACATFEYDVMDRLSKQVNFDGRTQHYDFSAMGDIIRTEDEGLVSFYYYDKGGRLIRRKIGEGDQAPTEYFSYNEAGQLVKAWHTIIGSATFTTEFRLDKLGRITQESQNIIDNKNESVWNYSVNREFDELGIESHTTYTGLPIITWQTYGSGHLHGVMLDDRSLVAFERDKRHRETRREFGRTQGVRTYDSLSRLLFQDIHSDLIDEKNSLKRQHYYDVAGQLVRIETAKGVNEYCYDKSGRLIAVRQPGLLEQSYRFDPAGNRLFESQTTITPNDHWEEAVRQHMHDNSFNLLGSNGARDIHETAFKWMDNRIKDDGEYHYEYDAWGNLRRKYKVEGNEEHRYNYDSNHRLMRYELESDTQVRGANYYYDTFGRRIAKQVQNADSKGNLLGDIETTFFGWDGDRLVLTEKDAHQIHTIYEPGSFVPMIRVAGEKAPPKRTLVQQLQNYQGIVLDQKSRVFFDELEQELRKNQLSAKTEKWIQQVDMQPWALKALLDEESFAVMKQIHMFQCDHLGTPIALINEQGEIDWSAELDAWGQPISENNPDLLYQAIGFQGQHLDSESGLYYNRHRYYHAQVGRYISQDPIGLNGGVNNFAYVEGNPIRYVDPMGLEKWDWNGKGDTSICGYYDTMSSSHPKCSYYKAASDICRGNNGLVNTAVNSGITAAWTAGSTSDSQATILEKIRKSLVASDKKARSEGRVDCNTDCVYGDDIDEYHNEAFNNAGLSKNFYGGNLWPQGVWPNPVPYDKRRLMDSLPKGPVEMPTWE